MSTDDDAVALYSGSADFTLRSWNIETGNVINIYSGHLQEVTSLDVSNGVLYSFSLDKTVRLWNAKSGELLNIFRSVEQELSTFDVIDSVLYGAASNDVVLYNMVTPMSFSF